MTSATSPSPGPGEHPLQSPEPGSAHQLGNVRPRNPGASLYLQVILAIILGVLLGVFTPEFASGLKPLGDGFIKLIKMLIGPIIFCTIVHGIMEVGDLRQAGRIGLKSLIYFELVTTVALIIGLVVVNTLRPGAGMNVDPSTLDLKAVAAVTTTTQHSFIDFLLNIIPHTIFSAFVEGEILQVLLVALLFAASATSLGETGQPMLDLIEHLGKVFFRMIALIMRLAPLGALGAMGFTVGKYGVGTLFSLLGLMITFYLTCLVFIFIVLAGILRLSCGLSLWRFLVYIKEELLLVLGTSSSEAALPNLIRKLKALGCRESVVSLVVPTGYSFNLDGTSIYLTMAAIFIAQATNTAMTWYEQVGLLLVLLLTSKGAAAVTGGGFIVLASSLGAVGHVPVAGVALILGIDRFMSEARALTNLIGNGVATLVVAHWESALDLDLARQRLGRPGPLADEPPTIGPIDSGSG